MAIPVILAQVAQTAMGFVGGNVLS
ncbi:hypothetical protein, partial [Klebsiella pneumoniae]